MSTYKPVALVLAGVLALTAAYPAAAANDRSYAFVDLYAVQHSQRIPNGDLGFGGRIGLGMPLNAEGLSAELGLFANPIEQQVGPGGDQAGVMLDLVQVFKSDAGINPFLFVGGGLVMEEIGTIDGTYPALELGLGLKFAVTDAFSLRFAASGQAVFNDDLDSEDLDGRVTLGALIPFGAVAAKPTPAVAARPAPAPTPAVARKDSDTDGVDDNRDECPGTLEGLKVDDRGCAVETGAQSIVLKGVNFLTGSTELTPEAKTVLDQAAASLAGQKSLRVELGGHTDGLGDEALNRSLSQRRADSVRQYLIGRGTAGDRLTAKGYGETQPIADNKTAAGRRSNRRVELKIIR